MLQQILLDIEIVIMSFVISTKETTLVQNRHMFRGGTELTLKRKKIQDSNLHPIECQKN